MLYLTYLKIYQKRKLCLPKMFQIDISELTINIVAENVHHQTIGSLFQIAIISLKKAKDYDTIIFYMSVLFLFYLTANNCHNE